MYNNYPQTNKFHSVFVVQVIVPNDSKMILNTKRSKVPYRFYIHVRTTPAGHFGTSVPNETKMILNTKRSTVYENYLQAQNFTLFRSAASRFPVTGHFEKCTE